MREIPLSEFIGDYEKGLIMEVVYIGEPLRRVYGRTAKGQWDNPQKYEVVWASVTP